MRKQKVTSASAFPESPSSKHRDESQTFPVNKSNSEAVNTQQINAALSFNNAPLACVFRFSPKVYSPREDFLLSKVDMQTKLQLKTLPGKDVSRSEVEAFPSAAVSLASRDGLRKNRPDGQKCFKVPPSPLLQATETQTY